MAELSTVGGHVVLDLVNTVTWHVPESDPTWVDRLHSPADLLRWAALLDLVDAAHAPVIAAAWDADPARRDAGLAATHDVRAAVRQILHAALDGASDPGDARATLHRHWAATVCRAELTPTPDGGTGNGTIDVVPGPDPALLIADRLTLTAVDLLRTIDLRQLKQCPLAEGGCGWLFLDRSRNGSRRWCSMRDCGTHVKAQRLTARRRAARAHP